MMDIHAIRLRGPWTYMPDSLQGGRARRVFHRPTGLEPHEAVILVIEKPDSTGLDSTDAVTLNQESLGSVGRAGAEFDITGLLQEQNELLIDIFDNFYH